MLRKNAGFEDVLGVIQTICLDSGEYLDDRPPAPAFPIPFTVPSPPTLPTGDGQPPAETGGFDLPNHPPIEVFVYNYDTGVFERQIVNWGGALFGGYGKPPNSNLVLVPPNFGNP